MEEKKLQNQNQSGQVNIMFGDVSSGMGIGMEPPDFYDENLSPPKPPTPPQSAMGTSENASASPFSNPIGKMQMGIPTDIDSTNARLGQVFSKENLKDLRKSMEKFELPNIPFDATLKELENLLVYQGNMLPYLMMSLEGVKKSEEEQKNECKKIYNEVYSSTSKVSADHKTTTIKAITEGNVRVQEANAELVKIQGLKGLIEARIKSLDTQNITVRKIITLKLFAFQHRLE